MRRVLTAIVSDLHLGTASGADLARRPEVLERLVEAVRQADRVVVLGDLLELRERPVRDVLESAAPVLRALGDATAGRRLVMVPGNHDHQLVSPALERARLEGAGPLTLAEAFAPGPGDLAERVAAHMPRTEVELAYPGIWLRDDVYATHGHYLDVHLSVPRIECIAAGAVRRLTGGRAPMAPDDYEATLTPIYAFSHAVAQSASRRTLTNGNSISRRVWHAAHHGEGRRGRLIGGSITKAGIPAAVAGLNALGLGPFRTDISAVELRRAGLRAIADVVDALGVSAGHVVYGHTHRAGPLPGDDAGEWLLPGGGRLTNTGSWVKEPAFVHGDEPSNPYWPGRVALLRDDGPPEIEGALDDLRLGGLPPASR
jgi:predicted phosphodiesterase